MAWDKAIGAIVAASLFAELAGVITAVVVGLDWEVAGLGAIVPLFLLPSIISFVVARTRSSWSRWSTVAYIVPAVSIVIWWSALALLANEGRDLAAYMLIVLAVSAVLTYPVVRFASLVAMAT